MLSKVCCGVLRLQKYLYELMPIKGRLFTQKLSSIFLSNELLPPSPVKKTTNGLLVVSLHIGCII